TSMRMVGVAFFLAALTTVACSSAPASQAAAAPATPAAEAAAKAADHGPREVIEITVFHDMHVDPDPVTLSKKGNHTAHWKLDGGGTLVVKSKSSWPMNVECTG